MISKATAEATSLLQIGRGINEVIRIWLKRQGRVLIKGLVILRRAGHGRQAMDHNMNQVCFELFPKKFRMGLLQPSLHLLSQGG